jgi:hypothetical protein
MRRTISIVLALVMLFALLPTAAYAAGDTAKPSSTTFVMNGQVVSVPEAYDVNRGNNCLQLRAIAVLLNGTASQFNVSWDGTYAIIETGKPYTGTATPAKLAETTNVRKSNTKFSIDGSITSFDYAYFIDGSTNYLKLREVAAHLSGTSSQFNVYYDEVKKQAVIEPGKAYTGVAPSATAAQNYLEEDVTWIGTTEEYKKTLAAFFDHGLRLVPVGTISESNAFITGKYGLVDSSGRWAAPPVYDEIRAIYWVDHSQWGTGAPASNYPSEHIFVDGYVQATRNGKMGLLDSTGKEVIPCEYTAVGLPVEGVCRLIQKVGNRYYMGYWNLELGREIVKPNKYIADYDSSPEGTPIRYGSYYKPASENRVVCMFDFNGGYALVLYDRTETLVANGWFGNSPGKIDKSRDPDTDYSYTTVYAQLIDKNGNEVLPQAYPIYENSLLLYGTYPQNGPYMVYQAVSDKPVSVQSDQGGTWAVFDKHLEEGVVGKEGIVIPAQYWGGWTAGLRRPGMWRFAPSPFGGETALYTEEGIIVVQYCDYTVSEMSGNGITAKSKTINFKGKDISAEPPTGTPAKEVDPDGNMRQMDYGSGIISGVQAKKDDSGATALFDVASGKRLTDYEYSLRSTGRGLFHTSFGDYYGPDGKIVFPRAATMTATINNPNAREQYVGEDLTLVVRDGKVGYVNASRLARDGRLPTTPRFIPSPPEKPNWRSWIETPAPKTVSVPEGVDLLADGSYYMQILGKYVVLVETAFNEYSARLSDTKPEYPFVIKLASYDDERGPAYDITYNGGATWNVSKDGESFKFGKGGVDSTTPKWKISKYATFCTIRKYSNQALAVNASGAKSDEGTKVTVWTYKGSAPEHAKINFIKAD